MCIVSQQYYVYMICAHSLYGCKRITRYDDNSIPV